METKPTLYLPRPLINQILSHAQRDPNIEACGLIGNNNKNNNKQYYAIDNVANNPSCGFLMDAPQQIKTMKTMREKHQTLFAIVHSHPTSDTTPSQRDINENNYLGAYYLIVSLNTKGVLELRAYLLEKNLIQEVDLILAH